MTVFSKVFRSKRTRLYETAINFYNRHEYGLAIEKFEEILDQSSPKDLYYRLSHFYLGQARLKLGLLYFAVGSYSKAVSEFERAIAFNPVDITIFEYLGISYNNVGEYQKAIEFLEYVVEREPEKLQSKLKLEISYHNMHMWKEAISICTEILQINPDYADVHYHLGLAYLGVRQAPKAVASFENALRINPRYQDARIKLGITLAYLGRLNTAFSILSQMVREHPKYADLHYLLGIVHASQDRINQAAGCFKKALEINPSYRNAKIKLGIILCSMGQFDNALKEIREARDLDPQATGLDIIIDRVNRLAETISNGSLNHSIVFEDFFGREGIIGQTINELNEHLEISPSFTEMLSMIRYLTEEDSSLIQNLISVINRSVSQKPDYPDLYNALGFLYVKEKRFEEGIETFRKALEINPDYMEAHFNLFKALKEQNRFAAAAEEGRILMEKGLTYPDFYAALSDIYISLEEYDKAIAILLKAIEHHPQDVKGFLLLAQAYQAQGDKDKAVVSLTKYMESDAPEKSKARAEQLLDKLKNDVS